MRKRTKEQIRKWGQTPYPIVDFLEQKLLEVSAVTKVPISVMEGTDRHRDFVIARQLYCYIAYRTKPFEISLREVGLGIKKDHATVMHSNGVIENYIFSKNKDILQFLQLLKKDEHYTSYTLSYKRISLKECIKMRTYLDPVVLQENFY
jgi:hypothetical protein